MISKFFRNEKIRIFFVDGNPENMVISNIRAYIFSDVSGASSDLGQKIIETGTEAEINARFNIECHNSNEIYWIGRTAGQCKCISIGERNAERLEKIGVKFE